MAKHKRKSSTGDGAEASKKAKTGAGSDRPMAGGSSGQQMGKVDPTFGQRSAIPGLDDDYSYEEPGSGEENLDYGSCASGSEGMSEEDKVGREAMQYLRAVRLVICLFLPLSSSTTPSLRRIMKRDREPC